MTNIAQDLTFSELLKKYSKSPFKQTTGIKGSLELTLRKPDGTVIKRRKDNLIVDTGLTFIGNALTDTTGSRPNALSHIEIGTNSTSTPVAAGNTALDTPVFRKAVVSPAAVSTTGFSVETTFAANEPTTPNPVTILEAGVFNAATGGIMFDRVTFPSISKGTEDTLTLRFTFNLSQS